VSRGGGGGGTTIILTLKGKTNIPFVLHRNTSGFPRRKYKGIHHTLEEAGEEQRLGGARSEGWSEATAKVL